MFLCVACCLGSKRNPSMVIYSPCLSLMRCTTEANSMNSKNKRYTRVATSDFDESLSSNEQSYGVRKQNARSIHLQYAAFAFLIVSNIVFLGLWWRATQLEEICVRPKVSYCMSFLQRLALELT